MNIAYNMDCMDYMRSIPDKHFDLAVVDPIYGDVTAGGYITGKSQGGVGPHPTYNQTMWEQPKTGKEYFDELFRVTKNQIIWGGNYFVEEIAGGLSAGSYGTNATRKASSLQMPSWLGRPLTERPVYSGSCGMECARERRATGLRCRGTKN